MESKKCLLCEKVNDNPNGDICLACASSLADRFCVALEKQGFDLNTSADQAFKDLTGALEITIS